MPEVNYKVVISKEGNGAAQAAAELQSLAQSATGAHNSLNSMNSAAVTGSANTMQSFGRMNQQTAVMLNTFKALDGTLRIIGFSTFPQITMAVTTAVDGMRALTNAARIAAIESAKAATASAGGNAIGSAVGSAAAGAAGSGLGNVAGGAAGGAATAISLRAGAIALARIAGPIAVIIAGAKVTYDRAKGIFDYDKALDQLDASMKAGEAQANQTADAIRKMAEGRIESGDLNLTPEAADAIDRLLTLRDSRGAISAIDASTRPSFFMSESEKAAAVRERMNALDRDFRHADAVQNTSVRNAGQIRTESDRQRAENLIQDRSRTIGDEYTNLKDQGLISSGDFDALEKERQIDRMNSLAEVKNQMTELQQLGEQTTRMFASGFSQAFVDFASGAKSAKEAFADFARSFLSSVAQMIMEQLVLNAISGIFGGGKTPVKVAAVGGFFPQMMAAGGMAGIASVSSPTYFPRFNVVAGEAGREMMTVLARPRMMEIGGMQAVVGSAQGNQLAITSASDLAGRGGGGVVDIRVTLGPELRAEIVQQSVKGAVVQVAQDMRQDTPISRGVKGLTA